MKLKTRKQKGSQYKYSEGTINLPVHDTDIRLKLPSGKIIEMQWRVESPSLDVCLPYDTAVTNWEGDDMEPAPALEPRKRAHERLAKQIVIAINPDDLER